MKYVALALWVFIGWRIWELRSPHRLWRHLTTFLLACYLAVPIGLMFVPQAWRDLAFRLNYDRLVVFLLGFSVVSLLLLLILGERRAPPVRRALERFAVNIGGFSVGMMLAVFGLGERIANKALTVAPVLHGIEFLSRQIVWVMSRFH